MDMDTESVDEDDVMAGLISIHRVPPPARVSVSRLEPSARGHVCPRTPTASEQLTCAEEKERETISQGTLPVQDEHEADILNYHLKILPLLTY